MMKNNERGMSMVEVLMASGILSVVALGVSSFLSNSNKEVKALTEKLATKELETSLISSLQSNTFCECLLRGRTFNTTNLAIPWAELNSIPAGYVNPTPAPPTACQPITGFLVPPVGQKISGTNVKIDSVRLSNVTLLGPGEYRGDLIINFDASEMVRGTRNVKVNLGFTVDQTQPANARSFQSCRGLGAGNIETQIVRSPWSNGTSTLNCPANYKVSHCHLEVSSSDGQSLHYQQKIGYVPNDTNPTGCNSATSDSNDAARLVAVCVSN